MKKILLISMILTLNLTFSQTQREMNIEAKKEYIESDNKMNLIYKKILDEYENDSKFIEHLKTSQRLWIKFRDAELKLKYLDESKQNYGNVYPMCKWIYLKNMTDLRTNKLYEWINFTEEGDVCKGSIRLKSQ